MKHIDGFPVLPFPELKAKILALPKIEQPIFLNQASKIGDHQKFIESHINVIEANPAKPNMTEFQMRQRLLIKDFYSRLLKYYYLRINLIEA